MLIKAQMLEQRTCSDHQCDLGASIRTWASMCRGCEAFFSFFFVEPEGADGPVEGNGTERQEKEGGKREEEEKEGWRIKVPTSL